jgi:hypothetical protein
MQYTWTTAVDAPKRDAVRWTLQGSIPSPKYRTPFGRAAW